MNIKTTLLVACSLFVSVGVPVTAEEDSTGTVTELGDDQKQDRSTDVSPPARRNEAKQANAGAQPDEPSEREGNTANGNTSEGDTKASEGDTKEGETDEGTNGSAVDASVDLEASGDGSLPEDAAAEDECVSQYETYQSDAFTSVGTEATYFVRYKGEPLTAQATASYDPIRVRIERVIPDCDAMIYEIRYVSDLSGRFDLSRFLLGEDGLEVANLKSALAVVRELLPDSHNGQLVALPLPPLKSPLRYKLLLVLIGTLWLVPILWYVLKRQADRRQEHYKKRWDAAP